MHKNIIFAIIFTVSICSLSCTKDSGSENTNSEFITVQYKADDSIFPNPERGLYTHRGFEGSSKSITANELK